MLFLNLNHLWSRNRKGKVIKDGESAFLPMELDQAAYMESLLITSGPHRFTSNIDRSPNYGHFNRDSTHPPIFIYFRQKVEQSALSKILYSIIFSSNE